MSRLEGVRFHKAKKFGTHVQTSTLGCSKDLSTVQTRLCKDKRADLLSSSKFQEFQDCPRDSNQQCSCAYTHL